MEPLLILLVLGLFGGLALALVIARDRRGTPPTFVPRRLAAPTPALINMANIRVEGIGGLGMVAAVIAVAIADSRIRAAIIIALVLGGGLALALIALRRRGGPLPSAGDGPDDRSLLHINTDPGGFAPADPPRPPLAGPQRPATLRRARPWRAGCFLKPVVGRGL
jgi:hypothetical protein